MTPYALYNEIDEYAADWLENLIKAGVIAPGIVDRRSIVDLEPEYVGQFTQFHTFAGIGVWSYALRRVGWPDDRPVWTGSCPCQPFSAAGKGEGINDERHLWPAWFRLIRACRPSHIFGEQVSSSIAVGKRATPRVQALWRQQATLRLLQNRVEGNISFSLQGMPELVREGVGANSTLVDQFARESVGGRGEGQGTSEGLALRPRPAMGSGRVGQKVMRSDRDSVRLDDKSGMEHAVARSDQGGRRIHEAEYSTDSFCAERSVRGLGRTETVGDNDDALGSAQRAIRDAIDRNRQQLEDEGGGSWINALQVDLEAEGYAVGALDTCSAGSGAPHIRQRLRIYAYDQRPAAGGLEHLPSDGCTERRTEPGRWRSAGGRGARRLDDDDDARLEGQRSGHRAEGGRDGSLRPASEAGESGGMADMPRGGRSSGIEYTGEEGDELHDERCSQPGGAADANGGHTCAERQQRGGEQRQQPEDGGSLHDERPGPTNGFWRNADWLFCRDEKWRPVVASYVEMVDGSASAVGYGSAPSEDREGLLARMSSLLDAFGEEAVSEWAGGSWSVSEQEVLRPHLHGQLDGRADEGRGGEEQPSTIGEDSRPGVRDLRALGHEIIGSPSGREPDEQRPLELADVVRLLPQSMSLAELWGRWRDANQLRLLQRAIREERGVLHASEPLEAAWASLGEEAQGRIRLAFDAGAWRRVVSFPLVDGGVFKLGSGHPYFEGKSRQGMLKGYGNAIDAEATIDFIEACLKYRSGRAVAACSVDLSDLLS